MNRPLIARRLVYVLIAWFAYTPVLGSFTGTQAAAQTVQNTLRTFQYDAQGNLTQTADALNNTTNLNYDPLYRLKQKVQPVPAAGVARPIINFSYDGLDQMATLSDPRNLSTSYTTDGLGNQSSLTSPDTGTTNNTYDNAGNVLTSTDARGKVTSYTYDALNRLLSISFVTGTPITYEYDGGSAGAAYAVGHLTKMSDESGQTAYAYDQMGHLLSKTQTTISATGTVNRTVSYAYSSSGKLLSLTYPSGNRVNYGYDAAGRVNSLTLNPSDSSGGTNTGTANVLLDQIAYAPFGAVQSWSWGNNSATAPNTYSRTFDLDGRVVSYPLGNVAASTGMLRTVVYDAASRITSMTHTGNATAATYDQTFAYDGLGRLINFIGNNSTQAYIYDANGNRTQLSMGAASFTNTLSVSSNRLTATTGPYPAKSYQYDAAGNPSSDGTITYTYNDRGRMKSSMNAGTIVSYLYNGLGQRVSKTGALVATGGNEYVYDEEGKLLGEYDATGRVIQETVYLGATPVSIVKQALSGSPVVVSTTWYYVYADHIASPRVVTSAINGAVVWSWFGADPFGMSGPNENSTGAGAFIYNGRFPGQYYDRETNLFYNLNRDYDPQTGRYIEPDPLGLEGGSLSIYTYVGNNPLSYVDPTGLQAALTVPEIIIVGGIIIYVVTHPNPNKKPGKGDPLNNPITNNGTGVPEQSWPSFPPFDPTNTSGADKEGREKCSAAYIAQVEVCKMTSSTPKAREACYASAAKVYGECIRKNCR